MRVVDVPLGLNVAVRVVVTGIVSVYQKIKNVEHPRAPDKILSEVLVVKHSVRVVMLIKMVNFDVLIT